MRFDVAFYDLVGYLVPGYLINIAAVIFVCFCRGSDSLLVAFFNLSIFFHLVFSYISGHLVQILSKYLERWFRLGGRGAFGKEYESDRSKYQAWWAKFSDELRSEGKEKLLKQITERLTWVAEQDPAAANQAAANITKINFRLADSQIVEPSLRSRIDIFRALRGCLRAVMCVFFLSGVAALVLAVFESLGLYRNAPPLYGIQAYQLVIVGIVALFFACLAGARYLAFENRRLTEITLGLVLLPRKKSEP